MIFKICKRIGGKIYPMELTLESISNSFSKELQFVKDDFQLEPKYVNEALKSEDTLFKELSLWNVPETHYLFRIINEWRKSKEESTELNQKLEILKGLHYDPYIFKTITFKSPSSLCADGELVNSEVKNTIFELNQEEFRKLVHNTHELNRNFFENQELLFYSKLSEKRIENYLNLIVNNTQELLTAYRILFHFERILQSQQLKEWIRFIVGHLLTQLKDTRMLLFEVLQTKNSAQWLSDIIQVDNTDTFLSLLSFLFNEKDIILTEDDFQLFYQQFPFIKILETNPSLDILETLLFILGKGLNTLKNYSDFSKQICQTIIRIFQLCQCSQRLMVKGIFLLSLSSLILEFPFNLLDEEHSKHVLKRIDAIHPNFKDFILTQIACKHQYLSMEALKIFIISRSINSLNEICKKYPNLYSKVFEEDLDLLLEMDLSKWVPSTKEMEFIISKEQFKVLIQLPIQDFDENMIKSIVVGLKSHQNFILLLHKIKDLPPEDYIDIQNENDPIEIYITLKFNKNGFEDKYFSQEKFDSLLPKHFIIWENLAIDLSMRNLSILQCSNSLIKILDERYKHFTTLLIKKGNKKSILYFIKEITQIKDWIKRDSCLYILNEVAKYLIQKNDFYFEDLIFNEDSIPYIMSSPSLFSYFTNYYPQNLIKHTTFKNVVSPDDKYLYFKLFYFIVLAKEQYKQRDTMFQIKCIDFNETHVIYRVLSFCLFLTKNSYDKINLLFWQLFLDLYFEKLQGHNFLNIQTKEVLEQEILKSLTENKLPLHQKILFHFQNKVAPNNEPCFFTGTFWKEEEPRMMREKVFKDFNLPFRVQKIQERSNRNFEFNPQMFIKNGLLKYHHQLRDLDEKYLSLVPNLYENKNQAEMIKVRCRNGLNCRGPAIIEFSAPKNYLNSNIQNLIERNRESANNLMRMDYSRRDYLCFLLDLESNIIIQQNTKIFYELISLYDESPRVISHLLSLFIMEQENENIFKLMLNVPQKIPLLLKYFQPIHNWKNFLIPISQKKTFPNMILLLKTFQVTKGTEEKDKLLEHAFIMILDYHKRLNTLTNQEIEVYQFYNSLFFQLHEFDFIQISQISYYFVINGMIDKVIPPSFIETYSKLPFHKLQMDTLLEHIYSTREILWKKRRDLDQSYYFYMKDYIKPLIHLITSIFILMETNETPIYDSIQAIFELFIFPIQKNVYYGRLTNDINQYIQPIEEKLLVNNRMIEIYQYCCQLYYGLLKKKNVSLNEIFSYYYKNLNQNLDLNLLQIVQESLLNLSWSEWTITNDELLFILDIIKKYPTFMTKLLRNTRYKLLNHKIWIEIYLYSDQTIEWDVHFNYDEIESIDQELKLFLMFIQQNKYSSKVIQKINDLFLETIPKFFKSYVLFFSEMIGFTEKFLNEKEILKHLLNNNLNQDYEEIFILLNRKNLIPIIHEHLNQNLQLSLKFLTVCRESNTCELLLENYFKTEGASWENLKFLKDRQYLKTVCLQNGNLLTLYGIGAKLTSEEIIKLAKNEKIISFFTEDVMDKLVIEELFKISGLNNGIFSMITFGIFNESYSNEFKMFCKYLWIYLTKSNNYLNEKDKIDQYVSQKLDLLYPEFIQSLIQLIYSNLKYLQ